MSLAQGAVTVMLPVEDVDRAKKFYQSLGLDHMETNAEGSAIFALSGGTALMLLPRPGATRSEATAMSWEVDDVGAAVQELEGRGATFEDYDVPGMKTIDHIATMKGEQAAWFTDPDGNVLCVHHRAN